MTALKPYREYKDSGIEWLGEAPAHWSISPIGRNADLRNGADYKDVEVAQDGYPVIGSGGEFRRASKFMFDGESVLFGRKGTIDRPLYVNGRFWTVDTMFYTDIDQRRLFPKFLYYFAAHIPYGYFVTSTALPSMTQSDIRSIRMGVPPLDEQRAIASFLDHETAEIDAFIADQQELIALLNERRAATITQAVTKGLDPNVPMKDSGFEWLGDVPQHWGVDKVSRAFRAAKGRRAAELTKEFCAENEGQYPVFSGQTENEGIMGRIDSYEFDAGTTGYLFATTVGAKAMSVKHVFSRFSLSQNCMVIVPKVDLVVRFYLYLFQVLFRYEKGRIPQHMQASFRMEDLYRYPLLTLDRNEQQQIADYLDRETAEIEAAIADAKEAIELSKERRTALISAAVTGKIDVRDHPAAKEAA
ncbi:restriction endonuclease subunit S [Arthrobacter sp. 35/47]|uniref:restriction endonuclease subunit S n=1 Tax=Arthrobacter sp. 35/47 TaxID=269454 RepID=UPI00047BA453|nr:restriction endonuclease subunit S [Arthrobacter sp. 35/47]